MHIAVPLATQCSDMTKQNSGLAMMGELSVQAESVLGG
jgi:hypothetical protein